MPLALDHETTALLLLWIRQKHRSRRRTVLTRAALHHPEQSSWRKLVDCVDDGCWRTCVGFYRRHVDLLARLNARFFTPLTRSSLTAFDITGLVLYYMKSNMTENQLAQLFGVDQPTISRALSAGLYAMHLTLASLRSACVNWPTFDEQKMLAKATEAFIRREFPHASVTRAWGAVDGITIKCKRPRDHLLQNFYYDGYTGSCSVSNVLVFGADGCVRWACTNRPGTRNDGFLSFDLYKKLEDSRVSLPGYYLLADCAFRGNATGSNGVMKGLASIQPKPTVDDRATSATSAVAPAVVAPVVASAAVARAAAAPAAAAPAAAAPAAAAPAAAAPATPAIRHSHRTSTTQAGEVCRARILAEWGMHTLRSSYPRVSSNLTCDFERNNMLIMIAIHLLNLRTRIVPNSNETRTTILEAMDEEFKTEWRALERQACGDFSRR
jgi:DDE superfamily endonuclease/Helix-turn-helix of DDE superfamily endonuclease